MRPCTGQLRSSLQVQRTTCLARPSRPSRAALRVFASHDEPHQQQQQQQQGTMFLAVAGLLAPMLLDSHAAEASLLTGRTLALVHPAVMFALLGITLYTGGLGLKVMRARNLVDEIKARKADLKTDAEGNRLPSPLDAEIAELEKERKELIGQKNNEKHNNYGALLLGLGVTFSVAGGYNTFLRTGKLFPGPHLYAGMAITVLWALAAAMVPPMQKGNEVARSLHITFNALNVLLFISQVPSGLEIVGKVFEFTSWP